MERYRQEELFPDKEYNRPNVEQAAVPVPASVMWNPWHGCTNYVENYIIRVMCFYSYVEQV